MRVLDLFSGIGGFSLGLERAGMQTVAFCEIDPFCRMVLTKHWPNVPIYEDVRELTAARLAADGIAVDVICGGFPCQDISVAGKGAGLAGEHSGLWREYARIIGEIRPRFVIVENTTGLLAAGLDSVLGELAALGYDADWGCVSASDVGLPHRRDRIWIVAYPASIGQQEQGHSWADADFSSPDGGWQTTDAIDALRRGAMPVVCREHHGAAHRLHRMRALGNAVVPLIPEVIGRAIMQSFAVLPPHAVTAEGGKENAVGIRLEAPACTSPAGRGIFRRA